ncbi:hypothetical protein HELRODRAFT_181267 [Helobdella robusta]|uniref:Uncharacterized protein n=1 Tax=Helobdella robusta TaxID=6412 RepID=T1FGT6_HELRO|nr:hypothetical protein HELRODRAFT_181267 [Helobdella robusta]ESN93158.1 hypothetical protein HELRODRAFT_181267 [Helobdella robusta]
MENQTCIDKNQRSKFLMNDTTNESSNSDFTLGIKEISFTDHHNTDLESWHLHGNSDNNENIPENNVKRDRAVTRQYFLKTSVTKTLIAQDKTETRSLKNMS